MLPLPHCCWWMFQFSDVLTGKLYNWITDRIFTFQPTWIYYHPGSLAHLTYWNFAALCHSKIQDHDSQSPPSFPKLGLRCILLPTYSYFQCVIKSQIWKLTLDTNGNRHNDKLPTFKITLLFTKRSSTALLTTPTVFVSLDFTANTMIDKGQNNGMKTMWQDCVKLDNHEF